MALPWKAIFRSIPYLTYIIQNLYQKKIKITSDSLLDGRLNALLYSTEPRSWLRDTITCMYAGEKLIICFGIRSLYLGFFLS